MPILTSPRTGWPVALFSALCAASAAQTDPNPSTQVFPASAQGPLSAWPVGLVLEPPTSSPLDPQPIVIHSSGPAPQPNRPWSQSAFGAPSAHFPDYSRLALTNHWWDNTANPIPVEFGGVSTGGDICPPVDGEGRLQLANPSRWYVLTVTVANDAEGAPGSLVRAAGVNGRNRAADIFSYYVDGTTILRPSLVNTTRVEYMREQLTLDNAPGYQGHPSKPTPEIAGLDWAMGVIAHDPAGTGSSAFPVRNRFYFTLTRAFLLESSDLTFWDQHIGMASPADAASIYVMDWGPHGPGGALAWSQPQVAISRERLMEGTTLVTGGLLALEIDALSVDQGPAGQALHNPDRVVVSFTPESDSAITNPLGFDQILVRQFAPSNTPLRPLSTPAASASQGAPISGKLGLRRRNTPQPNGTPLPAPDDVRNTCGGDPDEYALLERVVGFPVDEPGVPDESLGLSAARTSAPVAGMPVKSHVMATGIELAPPGGPVCIAGVVAYEVRFEVPGGTLGSPLFGPWHQLLLATVFPGTGTHSLEWTDGYKESWTHLRFRATLVGVTAAGTIHVLKGSPVLGMRY